MQNRIWIIGALALAIGPAITLNGCGSDSNAAASNDPLNSLPVPVPVRLASVEHTDAGLPVRAVGTLEAKEELRLSFKIGGIIDNILVDEGEQVRKGQRLASLSLTEIDAQLAQAQNGFDKADRDLKRVKNLFADTVATLEQLQNATTAWEIAKAGLGAAAFNRRHAEIYAPTGGRILRRLADAHEQVASGSAVLVLAGFEKGWVVRAGLADRDFMRVEAGDSATVTFDALPNRVFAGRISEIGAAPNPSSGTYEIEIRMDKSEERLVSGLIGKIAIMPTAKAPVTIVPIEALVEANGTRGFIYAPLPDSTAARRVAVDICYVHEGKVGIRDALSGIEAVVTAGATKLTDGAPIAVVR